MAKKRLFLIFIYIFISIIILPTLITYCSYHSIKQQKKQLETELSVPEITNSYSETFEDYIKGVVAGEMPALFHQEALKAQAVSARTYAIRKMQETNTTQIPYHIGQAYISVEEMKQKWGENFTSYYQKISDAVNATQGEIMTYHQEPILAVFHAQSSGKTENAENVWSQSIPYLKSVDSSVDKKAPNFENTVSFTYDEIIKRFTDTYGNLSLTVENLPNEIIIKNRSSAGYVQQVQVGNKTLTGKQVRETLGLRSANFIITNQNNTLLFTTKGYGHGAGMSQYGAQFMAQEGKTYHEILQHYYTDISFSTITPKTSFSE